ncbi:MAG TPA: ATP-binding protein [Streptosporangiaceae bacterium]|nr:ATP-binding protein [Streptosporangiaceae bacterium]
MSASNPAGFQDWPLVTKLELGPFPSAIPCARLHARLVLREWNLREFADDAELIVRDSLTTNAIRATSNPVALFLRSDGHALIIEVWDSLTKAPRREPHAIDSESGRGLELVSSLSARWGIHHPGSGGKVVWALLPAAAGTR